jgi:hypothetical protein
MGPVDPYRTDAMKTIRLLTATASIVTIIYFASALSPTSRGQTEPRSGRDRPITPAQAREQLDLIGKELREARSIASRIGDKAIRDRLEAILGRAELRTRDLADDLAQVKSTTTPTALPEADFDKLLDGLKKEVFDPGKLAFVENFAAGKPLSCQQAAALLKSFNFDELRIKAAKVLYPRLIDRQNFHEVLGTFIFDNNKAEVRKAVGLK